MVCCTWDVRENPNRYLELSILCMRWKAHWHVNTEQHWRQPSLIPPSPVTTARNGLPSQNTPRFPVPCMWYQHSLLCVGGGRLVSSLPARSRPSDTFLFFLTQTTKQHLAFYLINIWRRSELTHWSFWGNHWEKQAKWFQIANATVSINQPSGSRRRTSSLSPRWTHTHPPDTLLITQMKRYSKVTTTQWQFYKTTVIMSDALRAFSQTPTQPRQQGSVKLILSITRPPHSALPCTPTKWPWLCCSSYRHLRFLFYMLGTTIDREPD